MIFIQSRITKNTSGQNSRGPGPNSSQKRVKVERIDGQAETTSLTDVQSANTSRIHRQRDSDYYFNDGSIVFQVKDTLFKVHSSLLQLLFDFNAWVSLQTSKKPSNISPVHS
ncbi:hypothetical protein RSAG8_09981, partial [Rhizoctonia solani AG-8 WAC10335]